MCVITTKVSSLCLKITFKAFNVYGSVQPIFYLFSTAALKAYCAILVRRSNFRHQASPRVTTVEYPAAEGETVGEKSPVILPKCRFTRYI